MRCMDSLRIKILICIYHSRFLWEDYHDETGRVPQFSSVSEANDYIKRHGLPRFASPVERVEGER